MDFDWVPLLGLDRLLLAPRDGCDLRMHDHKLPGRGGKADAPAPPSEVTLSPSEPEKLVCKVGLPLEVARQTRRLQCNDSCRGGCCYAGMVPCSP